MQRLPLWTFGYKKNPAPATTANIEAVDERQAVEVAQAWCAANNARFFGAVRPFCVAGPEILKQVAVQEQAVIPTAIEATTSSIMDRAKAFVGGR